MLLAYTATTTAACRGSSFNLSEPTTPTATVGPTATSSVTPSPSITPTPTFPADALVDVDGLNLRAGPAVLHPIIGGIGRSTPVAINGRNHDGSWLAVRLPSDRRGWISARFVELRRDYDTIPTQPTPSPPPTLTPTPVPIDPSAPIVLSPPIVAQGDPVMVRVRIPGTRQVVATVGDFSASLFPTGPETHAGIVGIDVATEPGTQVIQLTLINQDGAATTAVSSVEVRDGLFRTETIELDEEHGKLLDEEVRRREQEVMEQVWSHVSPERQWQGLWSPPITGTVSSSFGALRNYAGLESTTRHSGMDFRGRPDRPVYAPAPGQVAFAAPLEVRGNTVWLDHGWGIFTGYFHLTDISVEQGQYVEQEQAIGTVGATGMTTGPHLHWEVRVQGMAVQPLQWLIRDVGAIP